MMLALRHHKRACTSARRGLTPSFQASQSPEPYVHFQRGKCNIGASLSAFQCLPERVLSIPAVLSGGRLLPWFSPSHCICPRGHLDLISSSNFGTNRKECSTGGRSF